MKQKIEDRDKKIKVAITTTTCDRNGKWTLQ